MLPVSPHQLAQSADQLFVRGTVQAHSLIFMLHTGQAAQVAVSCWLQQAMAGEWFLVGVSCTQAPLAVRCLACGTGLYGIAWRLLLAELASDTWLGRHGASVGGDPRGRGASGPRG